ncbi:class I SAM-dependent methyltransferase [Nonomuraea sp. M3C6]|uniref:S-adenosyl-L-methionine-dependent methyltransferase n=1 Tax=Nonomuraea marmarensis TaxID=3351344 RepID=A0ABW7A8S7_9ACTN
MQEEQPSQTAIMAAAARAAHLEVDQPPFIFRDTLAAPLLGDLAGELIGYHREHGDHVVLAGTRAQVAARSHYTEHRLTGAGPAQYVLLGAGLDTFAYRTGMTGVRAFEVDHPATQEWKRGLLAAAGLTPTADLAFAPVDFESDDLMTALRGAGFDESRPALVSWLGVAMYLTRDAVAATFATLSRLAPGSELVMEYALPPELRDERGHEYAAFALPAAADRGEPWLTCFTPEGLSALLEKHGLAVAEHVRQADIDPSLWRRSDALRPADLCRLTRAVVPGA